MAGFLSQFCFLGVGVVVGVEVEVDVEVGVVAELDRHYFTNMRLRLPIFELNMSVSL